MSGGEPIASTRSQGFWVGIYLASVGVIGALKLTDAIDGPTGFILLAIATGALIIPMRRAGACAARSMRDQ